MFGMRSILLAVCNFSTSINRNKFDRVTCNVGSSTVFSKIAPKLKVYTDVKKKLKEVWVAFVIIYVLEAVSKMFNI